MAPVQPGLGKGQCHPVRQDRVILDKQSSHCLRLARFCQVFDSLLPLRFCLSPAVRLPAGGRFWEESVVGYLRCLGTILSALACLFCARLTAAEPFVLAGSGDEELVVYSTADQAVEPVLAPTGAAA